MDAPWAREQLRRRYLLSSDSAVPRDGEGDARPGASTAAEKKEKPLPRLNLHSGFWILASIAVTYYVDFFKTLRENFHTSSWFLSGSALLLVSLSIALYCIVYLEWYRGIEEYDVRYPALIPITTAAFIAAGICFNIALWHVWSFLTPLLLFTQFMGVIMLISLLG
ncbi:transmembrane protein 128 isoform X1 [Oryctolagus cuniculus]|uniref:transmembrane protein 128 isoform X1 n=1 Tax=Oryctolagus cuniculus TaxID=9986 RepID=UPI0038799586